MYTGLLANFRGGGGRYGPTAIKLPLAVREPPLHGDSQT
jgi:hypothetical protein